MLVWFGRGFGFLLWLLLSGRGEARGFGERGFWREERREEFSLSFPFEGKEREKGSDSFLCW